MLRRRLQNEQVCLPVVFTEFLANSKINPPSEKIAPDRHAPSPLPAPSPSLLTQDQEPLSELEARFPQTGY